MGGYTVLSAVDELARVHALNSNKQLLVLLEFVLVSENNTGKGGTTSFVVDDFLDHTLNVTLSLSKIKSPVLGSTLAAMGVGLQQGFRTNTQQTPSTKT